MEIIDITYNFELLESLVKEADKKFNFCYFELCEVNEIFVEAKNHLNSKANKNGLMSFIYRETIGDIRNDALSSLEDVKETGQKVLNCITIYQSAMKDRVEYIESKNTQDEIYSNYKLREERFMLNNKIRKYEALKSVYLDKMNQYSKEDFLIDFGFYDEEDDKEYPEME